MTEGDLVSPSSCSVQKSIRVIKAVYAVQICFWTVSPDMFLLSQRYVSTLFNKVEEWQLQCGSCLEQVSKF